MHIAAIKNQLPVVDLLLRKGAILNIREPDSDWTPLHPASSQGHLDIASLLFACGATVNAVGGLGETSLIIAAKFGRLPVVKRKRLGKTALDYAKESKRNNVVEYLTVAMALVDKGNEKFSYI